MFWIRIVAATRWAPAGCKWSYNPYKWPYNWVTGVITLLIGVITPFITGRGPPCMVSKILVGIWSPEYVLAGPTRREWGKFHPQYTNVKVEGPSFPTFRASQFWKSTWLTHIFQEGDRLPGNILRIHHEQSPVGRNMLGCGPLPITVHIRKLKWNPKIGGLPMLLLFPWGIFGWTILVFGGVSFIGIPWDPH